VRKHSCRKDKRTTRNKTSKSRIIEIAGGRREFEALFTRVLGGEEKKAEQKKDWRATQSPSKELGTREENGKDVVMESPNPQQHGG